MLKIARRLIICNLVLLLLSFLIYLATGYFGSPTCDIYSLHQALLSRTCANLRFYLTGALNFILIMAGDLSSALHLIIKRVYHGHLPVFIPESLPRHFLDCLAAFQIFLYHLFWTLCDLVVFLYRYSYYWIDFLLECLELDRTFTGLFLILALVSPLAYYVCKK